MNILVMAAAGNQGRFLLPKLAAKGIHVRGMRAKAGGEHELLKLGAAETFIGDAANPADLAKALEGMDAVYHIGPSAHPEERDMGLAMVEAARNAGVRHFVFSSALHPSLDAMVQHRLKRDIEEALICSGLNFTILQPADYMQVVFYRDAFETGIYRRWWNVDRRETLVDLDDVTDVVARVLTEGREHFGATYELASGDCLNGAEIAATIERVTGRPIRLEETSAEDFLRSFFGEAYNDPNLSYPLDLLRAMNRWYGSHDFVGNPKVLEMLLGRKPNSFETVVRRDYERHGKNQ